MPKKTEQKSDRLTRAVAQAQAMSGNQARFVLTALLNAGCVRIKAFQRARLMAEHPLTVERPAALLRQAAE